MILGWRFMAFSGCPTVMTERCLLISFSYFLISHFSLFKTKAILLIKNGKQYHFFSSNFSFIFFSSNCLAGDSHSTTKGLENSNSGKLLLEILNIFRLDAWKIVSIARKHRVKTISTFWFLFLAPEFILCLSMYLFSSSLYVSIPTASNYPTCSWHTFSDPITIVVLSY